MDSYYVSPNYHRDRPITKENLETATEIYQNINKRTVRRLTDKQLVYLQETDHTGTIDSNDLNPKNIRQLDQLNKKIRKGRRLAEREERKRISNPFYAQHMQIGASSNRPDRSTIPRPWNLSNIRKTTQRVKHSGRFLGMNRPNHTINRVSSETSGEINAIKLEPGIEQSGVKIAPKLAINLFKIL